MRDERLEYEVLERLTASECPLEEPAARLVEAACEGEAALGRALAQMGSDGGGDGDGADGDGGERSGGAGAAARRSRPPERTEPPGAFLSAIRVEGFRGIGPEATLELSPGPGLTVVLGRNGSGKSSFAEGLETLLTGESRRWADRTGKQWRDGWRNLHAEGATRVSATLAVEGSAPIEARRTWKRGAGLEEAAFELLRGSERLDGLASLGWDAGLTMFRPFLSYTDLGKLLDQPSKAFDALQAILGVEELTTAIGALSAALKRIKDRKKGVAAATKELAQALAPCEDERATRCAEAIAGRKPDLAAIEATLRPDDASDAPDPSQQLKALMQLGAPALEPLEQQAHALREAAHAHAELAATAVGESARLAELLETALEVHGDESDACAVCGGTLPGGWREATRTRLTESRKRSQDLAQSEAALADLRRRVRGAIRALPPALATADTLGLTKAPAAVEAWRNWTAAPERDERLATHVVEAGLALEEALAALRAEAQAAFDEREASWRPLAARLQGWLLEAQQVQADEERRRHLEAASKWLKGVEVELRDRRFAPIADRAREVWELLRQQSNVALAAVRLEGRSTRRKVALDVSVDGEEGVAVGVMSQGELNALALSLFLPRMSLAESPFRFVIIDDPVQSMDPHKVDGLARVLHEVGKTRQVVVFTHDPRLSEALRRLQLEATILRVDRRARSVVSVHVDADPIERYLRDARQVLREEEKLGARVAQQLVPSLCRSSLEAACTRAIRRKRLGRGDRHEAVEEAIRRAHTVQQLMALALFNDEQRAGDVYSSLNNRYPRGADILRACKEGAHETGDIYTRGLELLVRETGKLARVVAEAG